jgi:hypothetical protein
MVVLCEIDIFQIDKKDAIGLCVHHIVWFDVCHTNVFVLAYPIRMDLKKNIDAQIHR